MAETRFHTPPGDSPGGAPHPPAHQAQHRAAADSFWIRLGEGLRPLEVVELALAAAGLTWGVLTHIAGMGHGLALVPAALACFFTARAANRLRASAASEPASDDSDQDESDDEALPEEDEEARS